MPSPVVTRIRKIVANIDPLADWFKQNRPSVKTISIFKKDWLYLLKAPTQAIRIYGFNVTREGGLMYKQFTLKPVVETAVKKTSIP